MHIPGRSEIIDKLANNREQELCYDVRKLSHEIIQRSGETYHSWQNDAETKLRLISVPEGNYPAYELFVQEVNDTDIHHYVYNSVAQQIRYEYPLYTWHPKEDTADIKHRLEQLLLSGPSIDKVPDNKIENMIQKAFSSVARKLVMENLAESAPEYRIEVFDEFLMADDKEVKIALTQKLYEKTVQLDTFTVGPVQFDLALTEEMLKYRIQQKRLTQGSETNEQNK